MSLATSYSPDQLAAQAVPDARRWYAVYTYPRHEKVVAEQLAYKAVESFLPTFATRSQWKDRRVNIVRPLFPGYVFTRITLGERLKVVSMPNVIRILSHNGMPAAIPDQEIETVRLCVAAGAELSPHAFLEVGERVRVRSGTFEGVEGVVINRRNKCKVIISIGLIQQAVALEIDFDQLERVPAAGYGDPSPAGMKHQ